MPATPAWPPRSAPRVYVDTPLAVGARLELEGPQAHYLAGVMRLKPGSALVLFDDRQGDFAAVVAQAERRRCTVEVGERLRAREAVPDLWLLAAPIRKARFEWLAEKASELGVSRLVPVVTARTQPERVRTDRLRTIAIEAAEQCGRNALMTVEEPRPLADVLAGWPAGRTLHFADETLAGAPAPPLLAAPAALLVGPEGGFSPAEADAIRTLAEAVPMALGPRILRAETAALAAVTAWMAARGDWLS